MVLSKEFECPDSNKNPKKLGNWYLKINNDPENEHLKACRTYFNADFDCCMKDFYDLWCLGEKYLTPPYPHDPLQEHDAAHDICSKFYKKWALEARFSSHIGQGTDPERKEHDLLHVKAPILSKALFPTLLLIDNLHQPFQKIHTLVKDRQISKKNKIAFGIGVRFPEVALGFNAVNEIEKVNGGLDVVGIVDEGYKWTVTVCLLRRENLHKHLDLDCRIAINAMQKQIRSDDRKELRSQKSEDILKELENESIQTDDWKDLSKLYRFWSIVHFRDLQQGEKFVLWNE